MLGLGENAGGIGQEDQARANRVTTMLSFDLGDHSHGVDDHFLLMKGLENEGSVRVVADEAFLRVDQEGHWDLDVILSPFEVYHFQRQI